MAYFDIIADDKSLIVYRPKLREITDSVTGAILLQQLMYWHRISKGNPFYKFKAPCNHEKYKDGDSWTEELGFSVREFDTAIKKIAAKVKPSSDKNVMLDGNMCIYWVTMDRRTFYQLNQPLIESLLKRIYLTDKSAFTQSTNQHLVNDKSAFTQMTNQHLHLYTETTTETTTKSTHTATAEPTPKTPQNFLPTTTSGNSIPKGLSKNSLSKVAVASKNKQYKKKEFIEVLSVAGIDRELIDAFADAKKAKNKVASKLTAKAFLKECDKVGADYSQVMEYCAIQKGWAMFDSTWDSPFNPNSKTARRDVERQRAKVAEQIFAQADAAKKAENEAKPLSERTYVKKGIMYNGLGEVIADLT